MVTHKRFIKELIEVINKHSPTPAELRYALKQARNKTGLTTPTRPKKAPKSLTAAEYYALIKHATTISTDHAMLIHFLTSTGLRVSEAKNTDLRDFDPDTNTLQVREGKGSKDRAVPFTLNLWRQVMSYSQGRSAGPLFSNNGKAYTVRTLQRWVKEAAEASGMHKKVTPHVLRHTYAYMMISKGMSAEQLQPLMGHEKRETTELYYRGAIPLDTREKYLQLMEGI